MVRMPLKILQDVAITRRTLFAFTLASAVINGLVTASLGAWLAQKYSAVQVRRQSINAISSLFYERRIRGGMVVSSLRRKAELDEVKVRKSSYDDAFVDWNKNIRQNLFAIREVLGEADITNFEDDFQELLVRPLSLIDACLTKAFDQRVAGQDPGPQLEQCQMARLYQHTLDCGAMYTNELYKMTRVTFLPFATAMSPSERSEARQRINKACVMAPLP
jgi:hypothetical protein